MRASGRKTKDKWVCTEADREVVESMWGRTLMPWEWTRLRALIPEHSLGVVLHTLHRRRKFGEPLGIADIEAALTRRKQEETP